jgi:bacterioferritin-associated ferredoxin
VTTRNQIAFRGTMIVCSCNVLTKARVIAAAETLSRRDPRRVVTPARILKELGFKAQCAVCFSLIRRLVAEAGVPITCPEPLASEAQDDDQTAAE